MDKRPWDSKAVFIFSVISGFPHKEELPCSSLAPPTPPFPALTLYKVDTRNKFWIRASNAVFMG